MLLCVMRALLNLSTGGNAYTPSPYIQEHTDTCTQTPMSKQVTDIRANMCACMRSCTHTHRSYWKTLLSLGHHCVSRVGKQRGRLCPSEGQEAHTWFVMQPVDASENVDQRPSPDSAEWNLLEEFIGPACVQTAAKAGELFSISSCVTLSLESTVTHSYQGFPDSENCLKVYFKLKTKTN